MRRALLGTAILSCCTLAALSCSSFSGDGDREAESVDASDDAATSEVDGPSARLDCKAPLDQGWSPPERLSSLRGNGGELAFVDPFVSADGLTLLLVNATGPSLAIFRASRSSSSSPWSSAERLEGVSVETFADPYPTSANPLAEVIISAEGSQTDIVELLPVDGGWRKSRIEPLYRPDIDVSPSLTADGVVLVFQQLNANAGNPFRVLYQSTRAAPRPDSEWSPGRSLKSPPFDGGPDDVPWSHPALTPDGLGLFYAVDNARGAVRFVRRKSRQDEFFGDSAVSVSVPSLESPGFTTYVRSVTADGCELYLTSDRDGVLDSYVSKRRAP